MSKDLLLSANHDLVVLDFDLQITKNEQILPQKIKQALLMFQGEWFLDIEQGVPYYSDVLGQKGALDSIRSVFIDCINSVPGVKELSQFDMSYIAQTRELRLKFSVVDDTNSYYEIELNV